MTEITAAKAKYRASIYALNRTLDSLHHGNVEPLYKAAIILERNKDRHHAREPETNVSLREEMSQKAEMWGEKASRQHNRTFSRGGLTLGCLSICLSPTLLRLQDDEGALVQVYTQSSPL